MAGIVYVTRDFVVGNLDRVIRVTGGVRGEGEGVGASVVDTSYERQVNCDYLRGTVVSYLHAITVPLSRLLDAPLRSVKLMGPGLVGFQVKVDGLPAVTMKLDETVGGFAVFPDCAIAAAIRQAIADSEKRCIFEDGLRFGRFVQQRDVGAY